MRLAAPQKVTKAVFYARVKEVNKKWLSSQAEQHGLTDSSYMDQILDQLRAMKKPGRKKRTSSKAA